MFALTADSFTLRSVKGNNNNDCLKSYYIVSYIYFHLNNTEKFIIIQLINNSKKYSVLPACFDYAYFPARDWDFPFISCTVDSDSSCLEASIATVYCAAFSRARCSCFRFPTEPTYLKKWLAKIKRPDNTPSKHSWLCSAHF